MVMMIKRKMRKKVIKIVFQILNKNQAKKEGKMILTLIHKKMMRTMMKMKEQVGVHTHLEECINQQDLIKTQKEVKLMIGSHFYLPEVNRISSSLEGFNLTFSQI